MDRDEKRTHPEKHGGKDGPGASCTPLPVSGKQTKSAKQKSGEHLWSTEEVAADISTGRFNVWNYNKKMDMYIRPFDPDYHYVFIDDVKGRDGVREILMDGFLPALVQESSSENFQVILKVPGDGMCEAHSTERNAMNRLAFSLNQKYGDPGAGRAVQNFRIPGFLNRKRDRNDFLVRIDYGLSTPESVCEKASNELDEWRKFVQSEQFEVEQHGKQARVEQQLLKLEKSASTPDIQKFASLSLKWAAIKGKGGSLVDLSEIDFKVAKDLLQIEKWKPERIGEVMLAASPDMEGRKKTWTRGYISKTVAAAQKALTNPRSEPHEQHIADPNSQDFLVFPTLNSPDFDK